MSIHGKLMESRTMLQAMPLKKSGHNKFAGYSYFELGDFLPAIQTIHAQLGLCGLVSFGQEIATLTITDTETGEAIQITSPMSSAALKGCHEVQNLGAVQTYIRRYLWVSAMEIVEHDAVDAGVAKEEKTVTKYAVVTPDGKMLATDASLNEAMDAYNLTAGKIAMSKRPAVERGEKLKAFKEANATLLHSLPQMEQIKQEAAHLARMKHIEAGE